MKKHWIILGVAMAAFALVTYAVPFPDSLTHEARATLGVAVFAIIVWMTQAVSQGLSGLIIVFLLAASGATDLNGALTGYSNSSLWLIVIGFVMAGGMEKSQLSKRIALALVRVAGGSPIRIYWAVA
ncbi:MAG: SLC13 family permease, partial [Ancrocorticia sp.]|uniref:SLC13 family permease n=1 Tax=Ancrocorticia sp. TaxID=2593684 RepID=UPI003F9365B0